MVTIRNELVNDIGAREALLDLCFGEARFAKASERLREGRLPADGLSFAAVEDGRLVGSVRLWHVTAGPDRPALLLGPLAVAPGLPQTAAIGAALMRRALARRGAARSSRRAAGRRRAVLRPLRLLGREDRRVVAARPVREAPAARASRSISGALDGARGLIRADRHPRADPGGLRDCLIAGLHRNDGCRARSLRECEMPWTPCLPARRPLPFG